MESLERRYQQLKERQELQYTVRLQDEAKRLKSLQEKNCRRRMEELKGDGREVRVWGQRWLPWLCPRRLGTVSPGCWDQVPPLFTAGAAVPAAAAGGTQCSPAEGCPGAQEEDDIHRLGVHQQDPQPQERCTPGWEEEEDGGFLGREAGGPAGGFLEVVIVLRSCPAARESVVWNMEQGHLQEKYQLFRQQVKEQHALQRQQLRKRHEKVRWEALAMLPQPCRLLAALLAHRPAPFPGDREDEPLPPALAGGPEEPAGTGAGSAAEKPAL